MARLENTLMAKTDAIKNVRDAETSEAAEDAHGIKAWKKRTRGGKVDGDKPKMRMDRKSHYAKGGSVGKKGKTVVNVIIGPQGGGGPSGPMPVPVPVPAPGGAPMPPPRPPIPVMPVGGGPGGPPPGMIPPVGGPAMGRARGGRTYPDMKAGAAQGEGRLEKVDAYGKNAGPVIGGKNKLPVGGKQPRQKLPSGLVSKKGD